MTLFSLQNSFAKLPTRQFFLEHLPQPISNNAVASLTHNKITYIASFNGLTESKQAKDITSKTFLWRSDTKKWQTLPELPGGGKLASSAVAIKQSFYIIGGYTIADDGTEKSTPEIYKLSYPYQQFQLETKIPIPVDDSVALVYQDRYLYLVSGWHDEDNVTDVQIYDTQTQQWHTSTSFPGVAVFGHTAAIFNNKILVIDGVGVVGKIEGKRQFAIIDQAWIGIINDQDISKIQWKKVANHAGKSRYRMAAFKQQNSNHFIFIGGSDNPYNYNGIGYDGKPSTPLSKLLIYDLEMNCWLNSNIFGPDVMDLRGVARLGNTYAIVGGMDKNQTVLNIVQGFQYESKSVKCN